MLNRVDRRLHPVLDLQFGKQRLKMRFDCVLANEQRGADLLVAAPFDQQFCPELLVCSPASNRTKAARTGLARAMVMQRPLKREGRS
jgi:hypothetical protein